MHYAALVLQRDWAYLHLPSHRFGLYKPSIRIYKDFNNWNFRQRQSSARWAGLSKPGAQGERESPPGDTWWTLNSCVRPVQHAHNKSSVDEMNVFLMTRFVPSFLDLEPHMRWNQMVSHNASAFLSTAWVQQRRQGERREISTAWEGWIQGGGRISLLVGGGASERAQISERVQLVTSPVIQSCSGRKQSERNSANCSPCDPGLRENGPFSRSPHHFLLRLSLFPHYAAVLDYF